MSDTYIASRGEPEARDTDHLMTVNKSSQAMELTPPVPHVTTIGVRDGHHTQHVYLRGQRDARDDVIGGSCNPRLEPLKLYTHKYATYMDL